FPLRIRVRNLRFGGAVSVPITVSAVAEKPVAACAFVVGPGPAAAETTETAATATRPASSLSMADRVALVSAPSGRRIAGPRAGTRLSCMAQAPALPTGFELPLEARLPRIGAVDAVALEERAASLAKRSIKRDAKVWALLLAIRTTDLTTLEGADTPGKAAAIASKARRPDPADPSVPPVAAVCVYPNLVPAVRERLVGSDVKVAAVATGFPSGQYPTAVKVADVRATVELGADEIDMVIDRGAFLSGRYAKVYDEIVQVKEACGDAHLKV